MRQRSFKLIVEVFAPDACAASASACRVTPLQLELQLVDLALIGLIFVSVSYHEISDISMKQNVLIEALLC